VYSIGKFAVMIGINKKTLRFYDEIDLFKPAYVDARNQYRYYEAAQITKIQEIIRLRDIGMSIEQIKPICGMDDKKRMQRAYRERLTEIEEMLNQLTRQKQLITTYQKADQKEKESDKQYVVDTDYEMKDGYVYTLKTENDIEDIHDVFSVFYENADGIRLDSGHILKMEVDDEMKSVCEVFAYTDCEEEADYIRYQQKEKCIKISCSSFREKSHGYRVLFDYAEKHEIVIKTIYEKYRLKDGEMQIDLICAL